jgi:dinuclear metal center YbgI/SA1388 family protein
MRRMAKRTEIEKYLQMLLQADTFKDYGPNGLQVEGTQQVRCIASGVTASLAFIEQAIAAGADTLLVHHGLFWRGHDGRLTGWLAARVRALMAANINLLAYHLPLDAHAELGNNAQLGARLGWVADARFGEHMLGFIGNAGTAIDDVKSAAENAANHGISALAARLQQQLQRVPTVLPGDGRVLRRVAWCTGAAQGYFESAIAAGADVFVTGEISEPQAHLSGETGVAFVACGHHASERFGAPAVAAHVAAHFGLRHVFIDVDNPA